MAQITPARKLFDLLVSRDFDPEMLDSAGKPAPDPAETEIFSFDFRAESGQDYGTVVIMLGNDNSLDVFCADNVGKTMEGNDKEDWFQFLEQLKHFAVKNFMSFSTKNLNRLRYSMQGQAAIKEGLFESWSGRKDISWNAGATESRLVIKHKRNLGEGEARFRYVESLFIETAEGERYKLPFRNLTAGRAMLEHVRSGGRPYDLRGQHIAEMVTELTLLSRFKRANAGKLLEGDTATLVEQATLYADNLKNSLKSLTTRTGYSRYFESWQPAEPTEQEMVIEGLKHLFVTQSIDQRIEDALPVIAKIQQQENAMKEANIFEAWAERLMEGTWQTPDTPEKQAELVKLLSTDLPVGADATNATEQLYDLLGDDILFDQLQALANEDANADARQVVLNRMQEMSEDPDVMKVITSLNIDATATMNPPEQTPADLDGDEKQVEEMLGGDASDEFIRDVSINEPEEEMEEAVKDPRTQTEDPAGTKEKSYPEYQQDLMSILKHAGVPAKERPAPDYEPEMDEGTITKMAGELGKIGPDIMKAPLGFFQGAANEMGKNVGSDVQDHDTNEAKGLSNKEIAKKVIDDTGIAKALAGGSEKISGAIQPNMEGVKDIKNIDWKDVGASTAGGVGGYVAGNALGGPLAGLAGATVGGAVGSALAKDESKEELDEIAPLIGAVGGALGRAAIGAAGRAMASAIKDKFGNDKEMGEQSPGILSPINEQDKCNMSEAGESCPVHGLEECGMEEGWGLTAIPTAESRDPVLERFQQLAAIKCN